MPPYLTPSPILIDQTFPRSLDELRLAAVSLGMIEEAVLQGNARLLLTSALRTFLELFEWAQSGSATSLLHEVHAALLNLTLDPRTSIIEIPNKFITAKPHPIPSRCIDRGYVSEWSQELGRILKYHDEKFSDVDYCLGVACAFGFSTNECDTYSTTEKRAFPLVGASYAEILEEPTSWKVSRKDASAVIRKDDVLKHWRVLGAIALEKPSGDSHRKLRFRDSTWTLDENWDEIDPRIINDLAGHAKLPKVVVRYALKHGALPPLIDRFP